MSQHFFINDTSHLFFQINHKKNWGATTSTRQELRDRNEQIYMDYVAGEHMEYLAEKYFLSIKSIQRIVGQLKREHNG